MSFRDIDWVWPQHDQDMVKALTENLGVKAVLARILMNRGISNPQQARAFLSPSSDHLHSPWLMAGMEKAVERIIEAVKGREKIVIHGDYDADGVSAAVILTETLRQLGAAAEIYLPSRFKEGYGLHLEPLKKYREAGTSLVVTVDCGINAVEEVNAAVDLGLDFIITDHHQPLEKIERAVAVINPLQVNCAYPFKELSGAGVAFKLACALMEKSGLAFPTHLLDLAALGTAADVVPLIDENRVIIYEGLEVFKKLERPGLRALAEAVKIDAEKINGRALSFIIAPNINAAGRMGEAMPAAKLLLEKDAEQAARLADSLNSSNRLRRTTESKILGEAEALAIRQLEEQDQMIITVAGNDWHQGVIGIVAARLVAITNRPVVLIALDGEEGRGSARSLPGFNITNALAESKALLERFGGHEQAAGFTVRAENVDRLRDSLNSYALKKLDGVHIKPVLELDAELEASDIDFDLSDALEMLEPFGTANPAPILGSRRWELVSWRLVGKEKNHLKLNVRKDNLTLQPIFFSAADLAIALEKGRLLDLAFKMENGSFRDQRMLELKLRDIRYSDTVSSENFEIIDWRGRAKERTAVQELLALQDLKTVIFAATASRGKKITENISSTQPPLVITNGAAGSNSELPFKPDLAIFYDLPLHAGILEKILVEGRKNSKQKLYLLYGNDDLEPNCKLTELALPSISQLESIRDALIEAAINGSDPVFPGTAADKLPFKPAPSFWERVEKVFVEIGFLEQRRIAPHYVDIKKAWPGILENSPTYRETVDLNHSCQQFQNRLLQSPSDEIAAYFEEIVSCRALPES